MEETVWLCMVCGAISEYWSFWQPNPDEAEEEAVPWVISKLSQGDPMALCPACGWKHRDTDDGSGFYYGSREEVEADRAREAVDFSDDWNENAQPTLDAGMLMSLVVALERA